MAAVSDLVAPAGDEIAVQMILTLEDSGPFDLSGLFPTLWEIDETDEVSRDAEIDDQQQWLAAERLRIAGPSMRRAIDDLFALACELVADPSQVAALTPRVDRAPWGLSSYRGVRPGQPVRSPGLQRCPRSGPPVIPRWHPERLCKGHPAYPAVAPDRVAAEPDGSASWPQAGD
jgi:hypothetical protein